MTMDAPRIYVACLRDYNSGDLHGVWIDLEGKDAEEVRELIEAMCLASPNTETDGPAEEWAIHDYEGFGGVKLPEYMSTATICGIVENIEKHGQPYLAWLEYHGGDFEAAASFQDAYRGEYESPADYAQEYATEMGMITSESPLFPFIDWKDFAERGMDDIFVQASHAVWHVFSGAY